MIHEAKASPDSGTGVTRILAFGYDRMLVGLRSSVLRMSGYEVEETFTLAEASELAQSDLIDALVICHSVPEVEREKLVASVRKKRTLMPIICVRGYQFDAAPGTCVSVDNSPTEMVKAVKHAIREYKTPNINRGASRMAS
jgi:DNA-binding NtrC family response regulator